RQRQRQGPGGERGPKQHRERRPLSAEKQEMKRALLEDHSKHPPPPDDIVLEDALEGALSVKGEGVKGGDVVLADGRLRELTVFSGKLTHQGLNSKLVKKAGQTTAEGTNKSRKAG